MTSSRSTPAAAILTGGVIAGILDLTYAFVNSGLVGVSPLRVSQAIASGLIGPQSYRGGAQTAALGVALHFLIAIVAAAVFYAASRRIGFLTHHAVASGIAFGIAVYLFMNLVVLPLSAFRARYSVTSVVGGLLIHMFGVGLPIALAVRRFAGREAQTFSGTTYGAR